MRWLDVIGTRFGIALLVTSLLPTWGCGDGDGPGTMDMPDAGPEPDPCPVGETDFYGTCIKTLGVFAQPSFKSATRDTVTANQIYHAAGVAIDHSVRPNRIYVADSGNQRVLGFSSADVDDASIVFGQDSFSEGACNRDANVGTNGPAAADTLCLIPFPRSDNVAEAWQKVNMDVDRSGNLYVPDVANNRVLRYNQPFSDDPRDGKGDAVADFVWGQPDFTSNGINHGLGRDVRDARSLFIGRVNDIPTAGTNHTVSVDDTGALWVADTYNNRVLRFPAESEEADLVLGQVDFESAVCSQETNNLCNPTIAKIHPESGELYVVEDHGAEGAFSMRIVVYSPPFENGKAPTRSFKPATAGFPIQATGLTYNTYRDGEYATGEWWLTEHWSRRVILINGEGGVVKVLNAPSAAAEGFTYADYGACGLNPFADFNVFQPGGSIGLDADGNIYIPDEHAHRIARFALPYTTSMVSTQVCPPRANGGLMNGYFHPNAISASKISESIGVAVFENQLIVRDAYRYLAWNDYLQPTSQQANVLVGQATPDVRAETDSQLGGGGLHTIDDAGRLWTSNTHGALSAYALPLTNGAAALGYTVELAWADDAMPIQYRARGVAFDPMSRRLFIADTANHRILRIQSIDAALNAFRVDMVLGQPDKATVLCNHNQPAAWTASGPPTAESLCEPYQIRFDNFGNLFVVENNYECHGNDRIVMFAAADLQAATTMFPNIPARKVFIRSSLTEQVNCAVDAEDQPTSPIAVAFNSRNEMVVASDGKLRGHYADTNVRHLRQLWLYIDPLAMDGGTYVQGQKPDAYIQLPIGAVGEMWFDAEDNLVIQDHTWSRVLMINLDRDSHWIVPLP